MSRVELFYAIEAMCHFSVSQGGNDFCPPNLTCQTNVQGVRERNNLVDLEGRHAEILEPNDTHHLNPQVI